MNLKKQFLGQKIAGPLLLSCIACAIFSNDTHPAGAADRCAFIGITNFSQFTNSAGLSNELVLLSPEIPASISWNELIASWNVQPGVDLKAEVRVIFDDHATKFYTMGLWSDTAGPLRESARDQADADGTVQTDTLVMKTKGGKVQVRISLNQKTEAGTSGTALKFLGLAFCDSDMRPVAHDPNKSAWGKTIEVPERRQADYPQEDGWCSPTALSMVLAYWSGALQRSELDHTVPDVAAAIYDPNLPGTGNWPFNTAYAGEFTGMRAYVTRFDDLSEAEDWISAGITPILSVSSYLINDRHSGRDNGHLIVCVGFTKDGDVVVNDPGVSVKRNERARRVYPRQRVIDAWKKSKNTVYLVYPEDAKIPPNTLNHWENSL